MPTAAAQKRGSNTRLLNVSIGRAFVHAANVADKLTPQNINHRSTLLR
jgi:hypothetical protein